MELEVAHANSVIPPQGAAHWDVWSGQPVTTHGEHHPISAYERLDKQVCRRRRGKECERLDVSTVSLISCLWVLHHFPVLYHSYPPFLFLGQV